MSSATVSTSLEDYTIAWVTALPHERTTGEMVFDEEYEYPENLVKNANDPDRYSSGRMGKHLVVIVSPPAGGHGMTTTTITAQVMRSSLSHIRVGLLVDIGAVIPLNSVKRNKWSCGAEY